ncbi:hypothetical protein [Pseudomonas sp. 18175]|uniref:hypothetical protein n=1 Tax=Pseudomonas sp. 18175 TaxID=3390056 RepID=UPI003D19E826
MKATKQNKRADYRVSLSADTVVIAPDATTFVSRSIELHSPFSTYGFVITQNPNSTQSNRSLELLLDKDIPSGEYPANGSGGLFHGFSYTVSNATPFFPSLILYTAIDGVVKVEAHRDGALEHFKIEFSVNVRSHEGETIPLTGHSEIFVKHHS